MRRTAFIALLVCVTTFASAEETASSPAGAVRFPIPKGWMQSATKTPTSADPRIFLQCEVDGTTLTVSPTCPVSDAFEFVNQYEARGIRTRDISVLREGGYKSTVIEWALPGRYVADVLVPYGDSKNCWIRLELAGAPTSQALDRSRKALTSILRDIAFQDPGNGAASVEGETVADGASKRTSGMSEAPIATSSEQSSEGSTPRNTVDRVRNQTKSIQRKRHSKTVEAMIARQRADPSYLSSSKNKKPSDSWEHLFRDDKADVDYRYRAKSLRRSGDLIFADVQPEAPGREIPLQSWIMNCRRKSILISDEHGTTVRSLGREAYLQPAFDNFCALTSD